MKHYLEQMPLYAAGQLEPKEALALEQHLSACAACRAELAFWRSLSAEVRAADAAVAAPAGLAERALERIHGEAALPRRSNPGAALPRLRAALTGTFSLLQAQAYLIKREMWPATAAVMALGVILGLISNHAEALAYIAPLTAAASLAALYGPENDPAFELTAATATSPWKILLARLSVISVYNLGLALLASLAMLLIAPPGLLGMIILGWLAPMAFLSALAVLLSIWFGTANAILLAYGLWVMQFAKLSRLLDTWGDARYWQAFLSAYRSFWESPGMLLGLSVPLLGLALLSTRFTDRSLPKLQP